MNSKFDMKKYSKLPGLKNMTPRKIVKELTDYYSKTKS